MDLKGWEKIKDDKDTVTMQHPKGHMMTIAVKALPAIQQQQLKRLKLAGGGDVSSSQDDSADQIKQDAAAVAPAATPPVTVNVNSAPPTAAPQNNIPSVQDMAAQAANVPRYTGQGPGQGTTPIAVPEVPAAPPSRSGDALMRNRQNAVNQESQALEQGKNIAVTKGPIEAQQDQDSLIRQQAQMDQNKNTFAHVAQSAQDLDDLVKQHPPDPNAIYENMKAPQRIATAIGLLAGGFTGGLNGTGNNPAMNWLKDQQEKNIQAQKDRVNQQNTVFGAWHQLYGDNEIADNMARVNDNNMMIRQGQMLNAKLATPEAQRAQTMLQSTLSKDNAMKMGVVTNRLQGIQNGQIQPKPYPGVKQNSAAAPTGAGIKATQQSGPETLDNYTPPSILPPGVGGALNSYSQPGGAIGIDPNDIGAGKAEFSKASQMDQYIQQVPKLYREMLKNATTTGWGKRNLQPAAEVGATILGGAEGGGLGAMVGKGIGAGASALGDILATAKDKLHGDKGENSESSKNAKYEALEQTFMDMLGQSTHGMNLTPTSVGSMYQKFRPDVTDLNPDGSYDNNRIITKMKGFMNALRNAAPTTTLERMGLVKKHKLL